MSSMKIVTNNVPRPMVMWHDLPEKAREDFDYVDGEDRYSQRFVKYKGAWYDVFDTQRINTSQTVWRVGWYYCVDQDHPFAKWDSIVSDSLFSGLLFRFTDGDNDEDMVVVGRFWA